MSNQLKREVVWNDLRPCKGNIVLNYSIIKMKCLSRIEVEGEP